MKDSDEADANRSKLADEDRLSALPDDILIHILLKLCSAAAAAQTSVLSSRWRRLWVLLPELELSDGAAHRIHHALVANEAPVLRRLVAFDVEAYPDSLRAWLPIAAHRISGDMIFHISNRNLGGRRVELPCFENSTFIWLNLGSLRLAMPASGAFARLTELFLEQVQLLGECPLSDVVSSLRCPALRVLTLRNAQFIGDGDFTVHSDSLRTIQLANLYGLDKFTVHSESLLQMKLLNLNKLQQLTVVAPALEELTVAYCFINSMNLGQLVGTASISAPSLLVLTWKDAYHPSSFELGQMAHLQCLEVGMFRTYGGPDNLSANSHILRLLQCFRFRVMQKLKLTLVYQADMFDKQYLMEDMTRLPGITFLSLDVAAQGHSFGPCVFHLLRMCTGVTKLALDPAFHFKFQEPCPSDCPCGQPSNWRTEALVLDRLQEVEFKNIRGTGHEVAFAKRLFSCATVLKQMTVTFDRSITESRAIKKFCNKLLSFSRPEIHMEFFMYRLDETVLYVPED
ncbi:FBD-associated F-box protein At5g38590 [Brachypodium distachyon]|uniref:F-box domain-containing protein n=1 Tax=Brachypodium distachyon TaxID=15368 RepID=I1HLG2_BRADI|nr:FBD-associated F-box protein At5g38590 [Brachypodium distachyon]KQK07327.1 hypothetical protein BRADI_2g34587v3 [Brachypodium distachyon]|eukprot:XP_010231669.1 FBD-associated F-box protein At5g38590 [Brachypodium distachyon]